MRRAIDSASLVWVGLTAVLACACGKANNAGGGGSTSGCLQNSTWGTVRALGLNDSTTGGGVNGGLSIAQKITVPAGQDLKVSSVQLPLYVDGTPPHTNLTLTLRSDNADTPGGAIASVQLTNADALITASTPQQITFSLSAAATLTAGGKYWINVSATYPSASSNLIRWAADDLADDALAYSGGYAKFEVPSPPASSQGTFSTGSLGSGREMGFILFCS